MCTLSVLFAYKVGLFNIGASGQYAVGAGFALYFAIHFNAPWWLCLLLAMLGAGRFWIPGTGSYDLRTVETESDRIDSCTVRIVSCII